MFYEPASEFLIERNVRGAPVRKVKTTWNSKNSNTDDKIVI